VGCHIKQYLLSLYAPPPGREGVAEGYREPPQRDASPTIRGRADLGTVKVHPQLISSRDSEHYIIHYFDLGNKYRRGFGDSFCARRLST